LAPGENIIPWEQQVKAIHIVVGASQASQARDKYSHVYGSRNQGGVPQGIQMRFVPDISDSRFPITKNTRLKAIKMMSKQKMFLANTKYVNTSTIAGIHIVIPKIGFSLCQVLMSIKSQDFPDLGQFISIDEKISDGAWTVIFTVHKDRHNEANALVPLLCIVLQAKYGPLIWEWFTDEAKEILTKYKWDSAQDKVVLIEPEDEFDCLDIDSDDEYMQTICNMMNVDDEAQGVNGFDFDIDFVVADDARPKNQYGDTGSVRTFRSAFQQHEAGSAYESDSTGKDYIDLSIPSLKPAAIQLSPSKPSASPFSLHIPMDSDTQATSTLSDSTTKDVESSLEQLMLSNPDLVRKLLAKNPVSDTSMSTSTTAVSPHSGVDGR
jgi:hypothetical protein